MGIFAAMLLLRGMYLIAAGSSTALLPFMLALFGHQMLADAQRFACDGIQCTGSMSLTVNTTQKAPESMHDEHLVPIFPSHITNHLR